MKTMKNIRGFSKEKVWKQRKREKGICIEKKEKEAA